VISFRKEETPISNKIYAYSSEETKNNRNIICEYSVGEYIKKEIEDLQNENKRLNNIINELEKFLKINIEKDDYDLTDYNIGVNNAYSYTLDKLNELKENS